MKRLITPLRSLGIAFVLSVLLGACAKLPFVTPPTLALVSVSADEKLNVDIRGRSTPVVVRYYLLKNDSAFNSADFFSLSDKDQLTLGDAIVSREEFVLQPGGNKAFPAKDAGTAQVLGIMVSFRNIDRAVWRAAVPLPPNKTSTVLVSLKNDQVSVKSDQLLLENIPLEKLPTSLPSTKKK